MSLRRVLCPLAVLLALGLLTADLAQAAPVRVPAPAPSVAFGGVHVGFGVAVPIGPVHRRARPVRRVRPEGRWILQAERVWVPGEVVGYDRFGRPIVTEGYWAIEHHRVWVPVHRHVVRPAPRGHVAVGFHFH